METSTDMLSSRLAAGNIHLMRRDLRSAGGASIFVGCLWLLVGAVSYGSPLDFAFYVVGGLVLCGEGIYVMSHLSAGALLAEAITLLALGGFNLYTFATVMAHEQSGGRPPNPIWGLVMLWGAWKSWTSRTALNEMRAKTNPEDERFMSELIQSGLRDDPKSTPDLIELKQTGFTMSDPKWRIKFVDGNAYFLNIHEFFRRKSLKGIQIFASKSLTVDVEGERWIGKNLKAKFMVDGQAA